MDPFIDVWRTNTGYSLHWIQSSTYGGTNAKAMHVRPWEPKMSTTTPLTYSTECTELQTTRKDWDAAAPELLESMLVQMHTIRIFEEIVLQLAAEGLVHGPAHSSIGQEGAAVGSILALRGAEGVNGTHRGHHQFLAKGLAYLSPNGMSIIDGIKNDQVTEFIRRTMSEILGLKAGFSGGRGGSMHLQWLEAGVWAQTRSWVAECRLPRAMPGPSVMTQKSRTTAGSQMGWGSP